MTFRILNKETLIGYNSVNIYQNGKLFYSFKKTGEFLFNLPKGVYNTNNELSNSNINVEYSVKLPPKERAIKKPKSFRLMFKKNIFKASIFTNSGKIIIDPTYKQDRVLYTFLLYHELGHYYYNTEKYCDLFAASKMLKLGFNPSQIYSAIERLNPSSGSSDRVRFIYENVKKI